MYLTRLIRHGRDCLHMVAPPCRSLRPRRLYLGNYRIRNGRGSGIAQAIRVARIGGFDLMILTETRITDQDYYCNRVLYNVVC